MVTPEVITTTTLLLSLETFRIKSTSASRKPRWLRSPPDAGGMNSPSSSQLSPTSRTTRSAVRTISAEPSALRSSTKTTCDMPYFTCSPCMTVTVSPECFTELEPWSPVSSCSGVPRTATLWISEGRFGKIPPSFFSNTMPCLAMRKANSSNFIWFNGATAESSKPICERLKNFGKGSILTFGFALLPMSPYLSFDRRIWATARSSTLAAWQDSASENEHEARPRTDFLAKLHNGISMSTPAVKTVVAFPNQPNGLPCQGLFS
mmetsp:Transcript_47174/g.151391  ORF Transcript_47174/g.151391 Transcript_47174/m.151391 type:complete len:263 (-) Transcript_47174:1001-1789(-)